MSIFNVRTASNQNTIVPAAPVKHPLLNVGQAQDSPRLNVISSPNQTLPNGGGTFNAAGNSAITPDPVFTGVPPQGQQGQQGQQPAPAQQATQGNDLYAKYRDPKTGDVMSPEEYAIFLGNKIPKGNGDIGNYAGDALTNPNQTANQLSGRATDLNNARNDIQSGTTDPYGIGNQSGIAYNPTELKAIENAYAGIYDPALNDVFARLKDKETEDARLVKREEEIFKTNENIRQWKATTGTKKTGTGEADFKFTNSQLSSGASNAGLTLATFAALDDDLKNFYVNPPKGLNTEEEEVPMYKAFESYLTAIENGDKTAAEVGELITASTLPQSVKHYFIDQLPLSQPEKDRNFKNLWGLIGD